MNLGFTGTRDGMTVKQEVALTSMFSDMPKQATRIGATSYIPRFCHGDCVGADAQASRIAAHFRYMICCHPPTSNEHRAFTPCAHTQEPKPYLERNHDIVDHCELLIATPKQDTEVRRSGTWATIRYAHSRNRRTIIIYPDGNIDIQRANA